MARPRKTSAEWFPHVHDMRNNRRIRAIRREFGLEGYALYNMLLEVLTHAGGLSIDWNATEVKLWAGEFETTEELLSAVATACVDVGLFGYDEATSCLVCQSLHDRLGPLFEHRERNRKDDDPPVPADNGELLRVSAAVIPNLQVSASILSSPVLSSSESVTNPEETTSRERAPARDEAPHRRWVMEWYRAFTSKTARAVKPSSEEFTMAGQVMAEKDIGIQLALTTVSAYFDDGITWWFVTDKKTHRARYSFRSYLQHIEEIVSALPHNGAKKTPKERPKCPACGQIQYADKAGSCLSCGLSMDLWSDQAAVKEAADGYRSRSQAQ